MDTLTAPVLSPLVTAYALEAGVDIATDTTAGAWGYYVEYVPTYAPGARPRAIGPLTGLEAIHALVEYDEDDTYVVTGITARFPAGTPYAYTL